MDQLSRLTGMSSPNDRGKRNDSKQLSFHLKLLLLNRCTKIYGPLNSIKEKVFYRVWLRFKFTFYNFKWTKTIDLIYILLTSESEVISLRKRKIVPIIQLINPYSQRIKLNN